MGFPGVGDGSANFVSRGFRRSGPELRENALEVADGHGLVELPQVEEDAHAILFLADHLAWVGSRSSVSTLSFTSYQVSWARRIPPGSARDCSREARFTWLPMMV